MMPPFLHRGERVVPARARPVCFCFQGLREPPVTSARVKTACVPFLWLAKYAVTTSCARCLSGLALAMDSGRVCLPETLPLESKILMSMVLFLGGSRGFRG